MRRVAGAAIVAVVAAALLAAPARSATPAKGTLSPSSPKVTWKGGASVSNPVGCPTSTDSTCDHFRLTVNPGAGQDVRIVIDVGQASSDFDVAVYGPDGKRVAEGAAGFQGEDEVAVISKPVKGTYEVAVQPYLVLPGATYTGTATFTAGTPGGGGTGGQVDTEDACNEGLPEEMSPGLTEDDGKKVKLSILVLLDGVDAKAAAAAAARASKAYAPLGITFSVDAMRSMTFAPDKGTKDEAKGTRIIDEARARVGGTRPAGFDVVYIITTKDLYEDVIGSSVAGVADCIGGIRRPERAFAVGEMRDGEFNAFGARLLVDQTAKVFAHEIGHLLGAKHDYANCVEGIEAGDVSGEGVEVTPCTLMSNLVDVQSMKFDVLNGAIVRGHGAAHARP